MYVRVCNVRALQYLPPEKVKENSPLKRTRVTIHTHTQAKNALMSCAAKPPPYHANNPPAIRNVRLLFGKHGKVYSHTECVSVSDLGLNCKRSGPQEDSHATRQGKVAQSGKRACS